MMLWKNKIETGCAEQLRSGANFAWGDSSGDSFVKNLLSAYAEVVHWKRNVFLVPSGSSGKAFVRELARLLRTLTEGSALAPVAMTAIITMPHLLLQKPTPKSRSKDHKLHLDRWLGLWKSGNIEELMKESRAIQTRLLNQPSQKKDQDQGRLAASFAKLMFHGRTRAALRLLDESQASRGVLSLDSESGEGLTVRQILKEKHPIGRDPSPEILLQTAGEQSVHPIVFEPIDANCIRQAALRVIGGAGPSGLDADAWRRLCTSFKSASDDLCNTMAGFAKRLCTEELSKSSLTAYIASRLVPLDKNPGARPIGVGGFYTALLEKLYCRSLERIFRKQRAPSSCAQVNLRALKLRYTLCLTFFTKRTRKQFYWLMRTMRLID